MKVRHKDFRPDAVSGFTLAELLVSVVILAVVVGGAILGYLQSAQRAEWNAHSLAAQSLASQGAEQARSAKWDPRAWPQGIGPGKSDELGITSYVQANILDVPMNSSLNNGRPLFATNYVSITTVSVNPPVRQIRSDCVWRFMNRGLFTNTVVMLRAADQ